MLDWLIVGGGIHGALLARVLVEEAGVGLDRLRVLDPHPEPLARFRQCAAATGLDYLRSSVVHHLDGDPMSLRRFAERQGRRGELHGIYQRPSIGLFDDHCDAVTERLGLRTAWVRGEALEIARAEGGGLRVETTAGELAARRVVLAVGSADQPLWPSWAEALRAPRPDPPRVRARVPDRGRARVRAAGRPRGRALGVPARALAGRAPARCGDPARPPRRRGSTSSTPTRGGWVRSAGASSRGSMAAASAAGVIARERRTGSVPAEIAREVERAVCDGAMRRLRDEVVGAAAAGGGVELGPRLGRPGAGGRGPARHRISPAPARRRPPG